MSKMLKPLLLPQLVEERRKRESMAESDMDISSAYYTHNSSATDLPSPVTPTFSSRGHLRYSSSASSMDVSPITTATDSPSSPTFFILKSGKRPLPDVQEEPQEREEDFEMFDEAAELYDCFCDSHQCSHRESSMAHSSIQLSSKPDFDYDLTDGFFSDGEVGLTPRSKKRRSGESSFASLASRIGTRFPSFSRKWRARQGAGNTLSVSDSQKERSSSRAASSRSSSLTNSIRQGFEKSHEPQLPPTPTKSIFDDEDETTALCSIDTEKANRNSSEREEGLATTPLLPPLMVDASASRLKPVQSPLQSPSVAESVDASALNSPTDVLVTPHLPGIPSPPLSTRPSISSFHRAQLNRPGHLVQTSDIPPIVIADANDEWANRLGHANFTIHPEPYLPEVYDIEACRQLRANWDLARCNYTKHLVRTGEHYGVTSKTYKLTEDKWAQTDATWKKNNDLTIQNTVESDGDAFSTLKHTPFGEPSSANIMTKIPSLNDPTSGGKFPQLGDEDIVGPMVQATAQLQRSPSKKAKLMKFFTEKFPSGLGRALS